MYELISESKIKDYTKEEEENRAQRKKVEGDGESRWRYMFSSERLFQMKSLLQL